MQDEPKPLTRADLEEALALLREVMATADALAEVLKEIEREENAQPGKLGVLSGLAAFCRDESSGTTLTGFVPVERVRYALGHVV